MLAFRSARALTRASPLAQAAAVRLPPGPPLLLRAIPPAQLSHISRRGIHGAGGVSSGTAGSAAGAGGVAGAAGKAPKASTQKIIRTLLHYVWPEGHPGLRARVVISLALLVGAKLLNVQVPFLFKGIADHLEEKVRAGDAGGGAAASAGAGTSGAGASATPAVAGSGAGSAPPPLGGEEEGQPMRGARDAAGGSSAAGGEAGQQALTRTAAAEGAAAPAPRRKGLPMDQVAAAIPLSLLLGYGIARSTSAGLAELRNTLFASVAQRAIRLVSRDVYRHLLALDLRFHLERQTGALQRVMDRGSRSINFVTSSLVFNVVPTLLEIGLVAGIFAVQCGWEYAAVTLATLAGYVGYTVKVTTWRTGIRKQMNKLEGEAAATAVDGLLNYEAVKAFSNEEKEVARYDSALAGLDRASLRTQSSLSLLNFGQNLIFSAGLTAAMVLAARDVAGGAMSVGDLILVNGLLFQLSIPLNFVGMVYREIRQGLTDMEAMFSLLETQPGVQQKAGARPLLLPAPPSAATLTATLAPSPQAVAAVRERAGDALAAVSQAAEDVRALTAGKASPAAVGAAGAAAAGEAAGGAAGGAPPAVPSSTSAEAAAGPMDGADSGKGYLTTRDPALSRTPAIEFRDVRFRYQKDRNVLDGVAFSVPRGATVGVVGPSGCGKSTLVRLLFRHYDVEPDAVEAPGAPAVAAAAARSAGEAGSTSSGSSTSTSSGSSSSGSRSGIFIHGQDVRGVTLPSLRSALCLVPQDTTLFNGTVHENIAYGRPGGVATREEVEAAARAAALHDAVSSWPQGYDTRVGERGLKLSGGEKQRVALARAVLKDAPFLLCDEATSALDTATEAAVMAALRRVSAGRTTLMIAHRLTTVMHADSIVVVDKGRVAEQGTHEQLLARGGLYKALWDQQRQQAAEMLAADKKGKQGAAAAATGTPKEAAAPSKPVQST